MRARVFVIVGMLSTALAGGLGGCAHDPEAVVSAALTNAERQGEAFVLGRGAPPDYAPMKDVDWGEATVHPAAYSEGGARGSYLLDTGDRLRVFVYGQPNLSRAYTVDHGGNIVVPLIGQVGARGRTTHGVQEAIRRQLGAEFVRDPQVTVDILQNRPFFIYGEVKAGGQYPYVSGMTVETAIAIAGGFSERASTRSYRITRRTNGYEDQIEAPGNFLLQPGDVVYVNERFF